MSFQYADLFWGWIVGLDQWDAGMEDQGSQVVRMDAMQGSVLQGRKDTFVIPGTGFQLLFD